MLTLQEIGGLYMDTHNDFLAQMTDDAQREKLSTLLNWIAQTFPELETTIKWNQPMFTHHGTFILGFSASKKHFSIAPEAFAIDKFKARIAAASYSATNNLFRIQWTQEIDYDLIKDIIQFNIEDKADCDTFWRK